MRGYGVYTILMFMRTSPGTPEAALQALAGTIEVPNAGALEPDLGAATASGHHGELLQGPVRLHESIETALVTLPDKRWRSHAHGRVTPHSGTEVATTPHKPKVVAAVTSVMAILGVKDARVELSFTGSIPISRGLGSSTADMISALRCVGHAFDLRIAAAEIARICHQVEGATDPTMFATPEKLLFASRKSATLRRFPGMLPNFVVATFDASETMGTVDTEKVIFDYSAHQVQRFEDAVRNYEKALKTRSTDLLKAATTESARINQDFLPVPHWRNLVRVLDKHELGLQIAHTGSVLGLIAHPHQHLRLECASREVSDVTGFTPTGIIKR